MYQISHMLCNEIKIQSNMTCSEEMEKIVSN